MEQKTLLSKRPPAATSASFPTTQSDTIQKEPKTTAIYLDACCMLRIVKGGMSLTKSISLLAQDSTVIIVTPVLEEFQKNLNKEEFKGVRNRALEEIRVLKGIAQCEPQRLIIEPISVEEGLMKALSKHVYSFSPKLNRRVGEGEAAIFESVRTAIQLFDRVQIYSVDSDVKILMQMFSGVEVLEYEQNLYILEDCLSWLVFSWIHFHIPSRSGSRWAQGLRASPISGKQSSKSCFLHGWSLRKRWTAARQ